MRKKSYHKGPSKQWTGQRDPANAQSLRHWPGGPIADRREPVLQHRPILLLKAFRHPPSTKAYKTTSELLAKQLVNLLRNNYQDDSTYADSAWESMRKRTARNTMISIPSFNA